MLAVCCSLRCLLMDRQLQLGQVCFQIYSLVPAKSNASVISGMQNHGHALALQAHKQLLQLLDLRLQEMRQSAFGAFSLQSRNYLPSSKSETRLAAPSDDDVHVLVTMAVAHAAA